MFISLSHLFLGDLLAGATCGSSDLKAPPVIAPGKPNKNDSNIGMIKKL
jgi:hypothetical protein